jgi:hypothetical protein
MQHLIKKFAQSVTTIIGRLCPSYMFRSLQIPHQGGTCKRIQVQQISKKCVCGLKMQHSQLKLLYI